MHPYTCAVCRAVRTNPAPDTRRLLIRLPEVTSAQVAVLFTPRRGLTNTVPGTITTAGAAIATLTPGAGPIGPSLPVSPAESLPPPEIVSLNRWAIVDAPGLDTNRIALDQPDGSMDFYAKAAYPDSLPAIVQQALLNGFEASGRIDAVAHEQDALHADYNLVTEIKDFAAHYAVADGIPTVTVALTVKLTTSHGRTIIGSFSTIQNGTASVNRSGA